MPQPADPDTYQAHHAAAQRAEDATLWDEAAREYEECLTLAAGADPAQEAALLTDLGRCYWFDGQPRPAWRTLRRAITLCRDNGDAAGMAAATAELLRIWGPFDRQLQMADEAIEALGDAEPHLRALMYLRTRRHDEAFAIADEHQLEDVLCERMHRQGWQTFDDGRIDEAIPMMRRAHEVQRSFRHWDGAFYPLRGLGFAMLQRGHITQGVALAQEAMDYAESVHLKFHVQLALMDLVGAAYARCDFAQCEDLLAYDPGTADFRADLFRMWMTLHRGDVAGAMRLIVDPERAGNTPTAVSQIHAAAAGMLYAAGHHDAAVQELSAWSEVGRQWGSLAEEAAAPLDCLVALGSDALVAEVRDAIATRDKQFAAPDRYLTLQGRGLDDARGQLALRLGHADEAAAHFHTGLTWADAESLPVDAARCARGLGEVAAQQGRRDEALQHFNDAAARFERVGAVYELSRTKEHITSLTTN